jgi:hypothetical protein
VFISWRKDQRIEFNGECKEPMQGNFNLYPGSKIDTPVDDRGSYKQFKSLGVDFNKGCRLDTFPNLFSEEKGQLQGLICEDNPQDQPYNPDIHTISDEDLKTMLKELHGSISTEATEGCPEPE